MPSSGSADPVRDKALLLLCALALSGLEIFIPRIPLFPWLKPGLANAVSILWIVRYGTVDAILFALVRSWIVGFYFGFSLLTLCLGLSGAAAAALAMGVMWRCAGARGLIGTVGMGVVGALAHNAAQLGVVYLLLARNLHFLLQIPVMLTASAVFGSATGGLASILHPRLLRLRLPDTHQACLPEALGNGTRESLCAAGILALSILLVFVQDLRLLAAAALVVTIGVQIVLRGNLRALWAPAARSWLLLASIASLHLFFSYGTRIDGFSYITHEGAKLAAVQTLRIWTWLQLSVLLTRLNFHRFFFRLLQGSFPRYRSTLHAAALALESFPYIVSSSRLPAVPHLLGALRRPRALAGRGIDRVLEMVAAALARSGRSTESPS